MNRRQPITRHPQGASPIHPRRVWSMQMLGPCAGMFCALWIAACGRLQFEPTPQRDGSDEGGVEAGTDGSTDAAADAELDAGDDAGAPLIHTIPNETLLASGAQHNCVGMFGRVYCWGDNAFGQLGDGSTMDRSAPVRISTLGDVVHLALGEEHSCALTRIGAVYCWGRNDRGQLGDGTNDTQLHPTQVMGLDRGVQALWTGPFHTCIERASTIACWGDNDHGQLGTGDRSAHTTPTAVDAFDDVDGLALALDATCALLQDASLQCLGHNGQGDLGRGTAVDTDQLSAGAVTGVINARAIAAGHHHACALHPDGSVHCWGDNRRGQCGRNTTQASEPTPDKVSMLGTARTIAASEHTSCVADESGVAKCWGANVAASTTDRRVPVTIAGVQGVRFVTVGRAHQCMRIASNYVHCAGDNSQGQLGNGTSTSSTTATQVLGLPAPVSGAAPRCGDQFVTGTETCDDGRETLRCNADCSLSRCGDGILNASAGETCETGGDEDAGACLPNCTLP